MSAEPVSRWVAAIVSVDPGPDLGSFAEEKMSITDAGGDIAMTTSYPTGAKPKSLVTQYYNYDESSLFGLRLAVREAYQVAEHIHDNIQITIPISETSAEAQWRASDGLCRRAVATRGDALIVPARQRHAIAWNNEARFVNLHIGVKPLPYPAMALPADPFLAGIARAGEMHLVKDPFLCSFAENVISLIARGVSLDDNMMRAFRLIVVEHMINTYASDLKAPSPDELREHAFNNLYEAPPEKLVTLETANLDHLISKSAITTAATSGLAPWQLRKVTAIIESDLRRDRSISELAELVDLSKGHFSRAFRASTGLSPRQWIIHQRVKLAIRKAISPALSHR
jgi:AraC-like DNA-binding protein